MLILKSKKGTHYAKAELIDNKIKILKGSKILLKDTYSKLPKKVVHCRHNSDLVDENGVLLQDIVFDNATSAAQFVTGRSVNGYIAWRVDDKISLKDYMRVKTCPFKLKIEKIENDSVKIRFSSNIKLHLAIIRGFYQDFYIDHKSRIVDFFKQKRNGKVLDTISFEIKDKTNKQIYKVTVFLNTKEIIMR